MTCFFYLSKEGKKNGLSVPRIEDVDVSPDNFELIKKISQGNREIKDDLMEKVLQRELKRPDLLSAWKSVKTIRANDSGSIIKKNSHFEVGRSEKELGISVTDIALSLTYSSWLDYFSDLQLGSTMTQKK